MKVKQIVSEHKKGVRAKVYAKKPVPLIGPEALKRKEDAKKKAAVKPAPKAPAPKQQGVAEGAKVDRMVKHITKSEKKLGHSKKEAENIAWATANKRGMLDNKNKK